MTRVRIQMSQLMVDQLSHMHPTLLLKVWDYVIGQHVEEARNGSTDSLLRLHSHSVVAGSVSL